MSLLLQVQETRMPRIFFKLLKKRTRRDNNINNDEENFSDEISFHNDKYDDSIDLDGAD